jgi:hypothetical protein
MGAIQNALNQITGSVGSVAKTAAVLSEYGALQAEQGELAKEQYHEASAAIPALKGEQADIKNI